jgi:aspartyl-tRNA(Asn)/glutamyl-tRNA(Gln) amidotransferase subunit C
MTESASTHIDVRYVAKLARLHLEEDEVASATQLLDGVLGYIDKLRELDVDGVEPMAHPIPMVNVFREDVARDGLDRDEVLANAPASVQNLVRVPNILD